MSVLLDLIWLAHYNGGAETIKISLTLWSATFWRTWRTSRICAELR